MTWGMFMKPNSSLVEIAWPQFDQPFFYTCPNNEGAQNLLGHLRQIRIEINDNKLAFPNYEKILGPNTYTNRYRIGSKTDIILPEELVREALAKTLR